MGIKKDRTLSKIRKNIFPNPLMVIMMEGGGASQEEGLGLMAYGDQYPVILFTTSIEHVYLHIPSRIFLMVSALSGPFHQIPTKGYTILWINTDSLRIQNTTYSPQRKGKLVHSCPSDVTSSQMKLSTCGTCCPPTSPPPPYSPKERERERESRYIKLQTLRPCIH